jgi:hypothetical protein
MMHNASKPTTAASTMVFANELHDGAVILEKCGGWSVPSARYLLCSTDATVHEVGRQHRLTIWRHRNDLGHRSARARTARGRFTTAIVVDEDGNQQPWRASQNAPIRIEVRS